MGSPLFGSLYSYEAGNLYAGNGYCPLWEQENEDDDERPLFFEVKFGVDEMQADQDIQQSEILATNKRKLCASSDTYAKRTNVAM